MRLALTLIWLVLVGVPAAAATLTGVNLAGGEFGGLKAVYGKGYFYPDARQMQAFRDSGMNVFRVPFRWERIQPQLSGPLDSTELARLDGVVELAAGMGASVILDVHNYARYARQPLGSSTVPAAALRDLWVRLADHYKTNGQVIFGLMNEPVKINAVEWAAAAQDAVNGIRGTGARNLILVPGTNWSGAWTWSKPLVGGKSNADAMGGFTDPARNMAFDFHQYFDVNGSGATADCISPAQAEARVAVATRWLRATGNRAMLTEFGIGSSSQCAAVATAVLTHMAVNGEWLGWTVWGSSAWFGTYHFNLYPFQTPAPPQLTTIQPFLAR